MIAMLGPRGSTVMIHGESGVGKELVAREIHDASVRHAHPFVAVDCTTLRDTLFESQLFGHVRGAFTGAGRSTLGFFRSAEGGTLLLDEVGELALPAQAKLLRALQERAVIPLGATEPVPVDVRLLAATHRDLGTMVANGEFREDLYFRLNVVGVTVPPLRDRAEDVLSLAEHFLRLQAGLYHEPIKTLSPQASTALREYHWPGNIRELANAIEHAVVLGQNSVVQPRDLPEYVAPLSSSARFSNSESHLQTSIVPLEQATKDLVARALRLCDGNQNRTAQMLQIDRRRLYRMVERYQLKSLTRQR